MINNMNTSQLVNIKILHSVPYAYIYLYIIHMVTVSIFQRPPVYFETTKMYSHMTSAKIDYVQSVSPRAYGNPVGS